jgi:hypothetical protein
MIFTKAINPRDLITCATCQTHDITVTWQQFANGTRHLRCVCRRCGRFQCYLPQTPGNVAMVSNLEPVGA